MSKHGSETGGSFCHRQTSGLRPDTSSKRGFTFLLPFLLPGWLMPLTGTTLAHATTQTHSPELGLRIHFVRAVEQLHRQPNHLQGTEQNSCGGRRHKAWMWWPPGL